jgi:hypothetical protein
MINISFSRKFIHPLLLEKEHGSGLSGLSEDLSRFGGMI